MTAVATLTVRKQPAPLDGGAPAPHTLDMTRRPATAADVRVTATLSGLYSERVAVTASLVNGRMVDASANIACGFAGQDPEVVGGADYRARDLEAHPGTLARLLDLARPRIAAAARAAVEAACERAVRKAAEERAEGDEERAAKIERRVAFLRAASAA